MAEALVTYKRYVLQEVVQLVAEVEAFAAAIKAGNLPQAQAQYASARVSWERIEPIAELFPDLDTAIDARVDDFPQGDKDPTWTGFHRIEMTLFQEKTTQDLAPLADRLVQDTQTLQQRLTTLEIQPKVMVAGATDLVEEMAETKITGEENRYSGADLSDFAANLEGSRQIVVILRPQLLQANPQLLTTIEAQFGAIDRELAKYRTPNGPFNGYVNYQQLSEADRKKLQTQLAALAENLAQLRGVLGIS